MKTCKILTERYWVSKKLQCVIYNHIVLLPKIQASNNYGILLSSELYVLFRVSCYNMSENG